MKDTVVKTESMGRSHWSLETELELKLLHMISGRRFRKWLKVSQNEKKTENMAEFRANDTRVRINESNFKIRSDLSFLEDFKKKINELVG